jgi:hypothetical protein
VVCGGLLWFAVVCGGLRGLRWFVLFRVTYKGHKNEYKKGQFEPAGLGKLIEKQFNFFRNWG